MLQFPRPKLSARLPGRKRVNMKVLIVDERSLWFTNEDEFVFASMIHPPYKPRQPFDFLNEMADKSWNYDIILVGNHVERGIFVVERIPIEFRERVIVVSRTLLSNEVKAQYQALGITRFRTRGDVFAKLWNRASADTLLQPTG